jgi:hypothetical protein
MGLKDGMEVRRRLLPSIGADVVGGDSNCAAEGYREVHEIMANPGPVSKGFCQASCQWARSERDPSIAGH